MYLAALQDIILSHKLNCMFYADDTQIYITLDPNSPTCSTDILRSCIEDVISWNTKNMLKCNQGKIDVVLFSSRFTKNYELLPTFSFGNNTISVTKEARNLVPRVKTSTYGDRAFSSAAPKLWNSPPDHIKSKHTITYFKSSLKTFLFKLAYSY
ncbi:hypothetical protein P5673_025739 [Acropora cervicornis]|uniref:Reverse transcriptase domain-containing protein n=1 Tax=Acropora cervicornis TaxID=6130 RepID=A0AAD9Q1J9_ACRCE|nr:hypothetical protein P5673_025739 [Acropora cervicornis]